MWCTSTQPASARRPETRWRFHLSRCPGFGVHFYSQWTQSATAFSTLAGTAATGAPTITGTAAVGQPLAVDLTGIADADGLTNVSYSYQWVRVDADGLSNPADITDATDATYTLDDADLGKTLKVRVTFDDDAGIPRR